MINNKTMHLFTGNRNWINESTFMRIYDIAKNQMPVDAYTNCNDMMNNMSVIDDNFARIKRSKMILLLKKEKTLLIQKL